MVKVKESVAHPVYDYDMLAPNYFDLYYIQYTDGKMVDIFL